MRSRGRQVLVALAVGVVLAPATAGCGKEKNEESGGIDPPASPASSGSPSDAYPRPTQRVPGVAADGVNDDQGGSSPGNQPSTLAP